MLGDFINISMFFNIIFRLLLAEITFHLLKSKKINKTEQRVENFKVNCKEINCQKREIHVFYLSQYLIFSIGVFSLQTFFL